MPNLPNMDTFRAAINDIFRQAGELERSYVDIEAGQLHRGVGGYPNGGNHRMPVCCNALYEARQPGRDKVIHAPPKGKGATLKIRYFLPR